MLLKQRFKFFVWYGIGRLTAAETPSPCYVAIPGRGFTRIMNTCV